MRATYATRELEVLASFVHGGITFGNLLGFVYNVKRKNWKWAAVHMIGVALHTKATLGHARESASAL